MDKEQIIDGLKFTIGMFLLDPITNETMTKDQLNDMGRTTVDACEGAIEILQAIPPEHDGCKDCRWQSQSETEMPCKQCMHNYTDEWAKKPHWIMKHRTINEVKYHTGLDDMGEEHTIKELIRYEVDEPYCSECGMKAGDTSQNYCCFCGAKMGGEEDG